MKKSEWLDCQGNEFFPKQKGTPSLVKIEHKNTATLDSSRSKKNLKSQFCNYLTACTVLEGCRMFKQCRNLSASTLLQVCKLFKRCCKLSAGHCVAGVQAI